MKTLVVVLCLFLRAGAERQDLSGKMLTFPKESNQHHVTLSPEKTNDMQTVTVCLRAFSDLSRSQTLFSLAIPSSDNAFLIYKPNRGVYRLHAVQEAVEFWGLKDDLNVWNSVCATWDGKTGLSQHWINAQPSSRKLLALGKSLTGIPKIILGQEQDNYGGGFDQKQSFVGMLTDVHMWDYILSPSQIVTYTNGGSFQTGNVINWTSLEYSTKGTVYVESTKYANVETNYFF